MFFFGALRPMRKRLFSPFLALIFTLCGAVLSPLSVAQTPQTFYSQNFEGAVGGEWTVTATRSVPAVSGKHLGPLQRGPVDLRLSGLPEHKAVTVSFDLLILASMDGNGDFCCGPDVWSLAVRGGPTLIRTTFSGDKTNGVVNENKQAYPGQYPGAANPAQTGAAHTYTAAADGTPETISVYHMAYTIPHSGANLSLEFLSLQDDGYPNEGWGLDNVTVTDADPATLTLGKITTISGDGTPGYEDGPGVFGNQLNTPYDVASYDLRNVGFQGYQNYVADSNNNRVRIFTGDGSLSSDVGGGTDPDSTDPDQILLNFPKGVLVDRNLGVYFSDTLHHRVLKKQSGQVKVIAGTGAVGFSGDGGAATLAQLAAPTRLALDLKGNLYIADTGNNRIRKVGLDGKISTVAGGGTQAPEFQEVLATDLQLKSPTGVAVDPSGRLFVSDSLDNCILLVNGDTASIYAGTKEAGFGGDGGAAMFAKFNSPQGLALDYAGNLYVADTGNHRVRVVELGPGGSLGGGLVGTLAGTGTAARTGDGGPANEATLNTPRGVTVNSDGDLYIADTSNHSIRKVNRVAAPGVSGAFPDVRASQPPFVKAFDLLSPPPYRPGQDVPIQVTVESFLNVTSAVAHPEATDPVSLKMNPDGTWTGTVHIPATFNETTDAVYIWLTDEAGHTDNSFFYPIPITLTTVPIVTIQSVSPATGPYFPLQTIGVTASIDSPRPLTEVKAFMGSTAVANLTRQGTTSVWSGSIQIPDPGLTAQSISLFVAAKNDKGESGDARHDLTLDQSPPVITEFLVQPFGPYTQGQDVEVSIKVSSRYPLLPGGMTVKIGPGSAVPLQLVGTTWRARTKVLTATDTAATADLLATARNSRGQEATQTWQLPVDRSYKITLLSVDERGPFLPGQTLHVTATLGASFPIGSVFVTGQIGSAPPVRLGSRVDNTFKGEVRVPGDLTSALSFITVAASDDQGRKGGLTLPLAVDQTPPSVTGYSVDPKGPYTAGQNLRVNVTMNNARRLTRLTAQVAGGETVSLTHVDGSGTGADNHWTGIVRIPTLDPSVTKVNVTVSARDEMGRTGGTVISDLPITKNPINFTDFSVNPPGPYTPGQRVAVHVKATGISTITSMTARLGSGSPTSLRFNGTEWNTEMSVPPLNQIGNAFDITITATDDAGRTGVFVWKDTTVDAEPFKVLSFSPTPDVINTGGQKITVSVKVQSSKPLTDVIVSSGAGGRVPLRASGDSYVGQVLLPTVGPDTNQIPIQIYLRDEAGREFRESPNIGIKPGSFDPNGAPPALVSEDVESDPKTGRNVLKLGWLVFSADHIEKSGQSGDGNQLTYQLSGNVSTNDFLRYDGDVTAVLTKSDVAADVSIDSGRLYLDGIPYYGQVTLWQGQKLKFHIDGRGQLTNLINTGLGQAFKLAGLDLPIKSAGLQLPNLNVPGSQFPGIKINGDLNFPIPQIPGFNIPVVQGLKVSVQELTVSRAGLRFTGDIGLPEINVGAFKITDGRLHFVAAHDGIPDLFEGSGKLIVPNVFNLDAEVKFVGGNLNAVRAAVNGFTVPVGPLLVITGGEIAAKGLDHTEPFTLFLGVDLTIGQEWIKNVVQLSHAGITYTYPTKFAGSSDLNILTAKAAEAALNIDLPYELGFSGQVGLLDSFTVFDVGFGVKGGIGKNAAGQLTSPYFEGDAHGKVQVPNGTGFPFDALRTFITLPYPILDAGVGVHDGRFNYYTKFHLFDTPIGSVDFALNALVAWINNAAEVSVGTNYGQLPTIRIGLLKDLAPFEVWTSSYDPVMLKSLKRDRASLGGNALEGQGLYLPRTKGGGFRPLDDPPPDQDGTPVDLATVKVAADTPQVVFRLYGNAGAPRFTLTEPDGTTTITPETAAQNGAAFTYNAAENVSFYFVVNPPAGDWKVTAEDGSGGPYVLDAFGAMAPPVVNDVTVTPAASSAQIDYNVTDADSAASVSLYYDTDNQGFDGALLADGLTKGEAGTYAWNFSDGSVRSGEYYVYAVADDGSTTPDRKYAATKVTVADPKAPPAPVAVAVLTGPENSLTVTWSAPTAGAVDGYEVRFAVDGGAGTVLDQAANAAANTSIRLTKLADNTTYRVAVVAYKLGDAADPSDLVHKSLPSASATGKTGVAAPPVVHLTAPAGGETLNNNHQVTLAWTVDNGDDLVDQRVEISTDAGETFTPMADAGTTDRSSVWQVPAGMQGKTVRVRVVAVDSSGNEGSASSGDFSIVNAAPQIAAVKPGTLTLNQPATLVVTGSDFAPDAMVKLDGQSLATTYLNGGMLTAEAPGEMLAKEGTLKAVVANPDGQAAEASITVTVMCGDADLNGAVDVSDAVEVLKSIVGVETLTGPQTRAADTDRSGSVDVTDAVKILRIVVGLAPPCDAALP